MMLSVEILRGVMPSAPLPWLEQMVAQLPAAGFDTDHEVASFVAQVAHESKEFRTLQENLNYSAERLMVVWKKRFPTLDFAKDYEHNPEKLGNYVYANRNGNGDEASGDGYRFRGRGPLQITGRSHYSRCAGDIMSPIVFDPDLLLLPAIGIRSAIWYWQADGLDKVDDDDDVRLETRAINGGELGLADRQAYFDRYMQLATA